MSETPDGRRCVVTVTDRAYLPGTELLFWSFLRHNPAFDGDLVVVHGEPDRRVTRRLSVFPRVRFRTVATELARSLERLATAHPRLRPVLGRFYALEAFALEGYETVLLLDSDILCTRGVDALFDAKGPGVACPDKTAYRGEVRDPDTFLPVPTSSRPTGRPTFNSGVLLLRPARLGGDVQQALLDALHPDQWGDIRSGHTDQVVLNRVLADRVRIGWPEWNHLLAPNGDGWDRPPMEQAAFLHYLGGMKPWRMMGTVPPEHAGAQQRVAWRLWEEAFAEYAADRGRRGDVGPLLRLARARVRRVAVGWWRSAIRSAPG